LGERLRLLSGGWRTGVGRQQTLSATLDWSYVLLDGQEQVVFDRLSVFVGWLTLDDALAVVGDSTLGDLDILDAISALADKSMCTVDVHATPTRYRYLETMRSYGRDHLHKSGALTEFRDRHAAHLAASARVITQMLVGPDELEASRRAERLMPELRAALGWAVERHLDDVIDDIAVLAVPVGAKSSYEMIGWFYDLRHDLLDRPAVQTAAMVHALHAKADYTETRRLAHWLIEMSTDEPWFAWFSLSTVEYNESHFDRTVEYQTRAYEIGEARPDDRWVHTQNPTWLAVFLAASGHDPGDLIEQSFARARAAQWPSALAAAHFAAGLARLLHTDQSASLEHLHRGLELAIQIGNGTVESLCQMSISALQFAVLPPGELAMVLIRQLRGLQDAGATNGAPLALSQVLILLNQTERWRTAALICGWLDGRSGQGAQTIDDHQAAIASVREALGDQWDKLLEQGRDMTSTHILDIACDELQTIDASVP
jgi:hypothetical protein